jgi:hypothetical protein
MAAYSRPSASPEIAILGEDHQKNAKKTLKAIIDCSVGISHYDEI